MSLLTLDAPRRQHRRETRNQRQTFEQVRRAEADYQRKLRKIADQVAHLADLIDANTPGALHRATELLKRYAEDITPWAKAVAAGMLADVNHRDMKAWLRLSDLMGEELEYEIRNTPIGARMQQLMAEQVHYITSIPLDAAERVHKFALQNITEGLRFEGISKALQTSGQVARGKADLIARTEVGRCSSVLTQSRAEYVGSPGYIWRTVRDNDVRKEHKHLEGTFHKWTQPPVAGTKGMRYHAGAGPNCRCYPEPVLQ